MVSVEFGLLSGRDILDQKTFRTLAAARAEGTGQSGFTVWDIVDALRHQKLLILAVTVLTTALGTVYAITSPPRYSASSQLIIESRRVIPFTGQAVVQDSAIDTTIADSQVEVLKSEAVILAAIDSLNLLEDPEFTGNQTSVTRSFLERFGVLQPGSNTDQVGRALRHLRENLSVRRVGRTYVIQVSFLSRSRDTATKVANAVVHAYIFGQVRSNVSATAEASEWLRDRLAELRNDAMKADAEVQEYIAKNNLITAQPGRTLTEQQLTDLQAQLISLRGEVAEAKARFDALTASEGTDPGSIATIGSFNNPVLTRLRDQYLDMHRQEAEFVSRYGENHPAVAEIRQNLQSLRDASREEIRRTAAAFQTGVRGRALPPRLARAVAERDLGCDRGRDAGGRVAPHPRELCAILPPPLRLVPAAVRRLEAAAILSARGCEGADDGARRREVRAEF